MSFGVSNTLGAFDKEGLKVEASMDGDDWYPFAYETGTVASGWGKASAIFHIIGVDRMYLRFTGKAGYAIDDLLLLEGSESDNGYELEFSLDGDDNYKPGYVYFSDDFDWVTYEFGGTDYVGNPQLNTAETRFDNVYTLSQELVDKFEQAGWVQTDNSRPVYLRLGYIKLGKSRTAGLVQSPALTAIREGRTVHAELTFKATGYEGSGGARDLGDIKIEVVGGGTINSATQTELEIPLATYNAWTEDPIAVRIYNATTDTRIIFKSAYSTEYLTAAGRLQPFLHRRGCAVENPEKHRNRGELVGNARNAGCRRTERIGFVIVAHRFVGSNRPRIPLRIHSTQGIRRQNRRARHIGDAVMHRERPRNRRRLRTFCTRARTCRIAALPAVGVDRTCRRNHHRQGRASVRLRILRGQFRLARRDMGYGGQGGGLGSRILRPGVQGHNHGELLRRKGRRMDFARIRIRDEQVPRVHQSRQSENRSYRQREPRTSATMRDTSYCRRTPLPTSRTEHQSTSSSKWTYAR